MVLTFKQSHTPKVPQGNEWVTHGWGKRWMFLCPNHVHFLCYILCSGTIHWLLMKTVVGF